MLSIVYASIAARPFAGDDLEALLEQSREADQRHGLTGLLAHRDGRFLQLIEGNDDAVREPMATIEADPRHGQVRVLLEDEIDERRAPPGPWGTAHPTSASGRCRRTAAPSTTSTTTARRAASCRRCGR